MWSNKHLHDIVNEAVMKITQRLGDITVVPCPDPYDVSEKDWAVLHIAITGLGENNFSFYYRADSSIYRSIAEHMKGGPVTDMDEMEMYLKEYFNILCGNIVSRINRDQKLAMRFGIPDYYAKGVVTCEAPLMRVCYECKDGDGAISITGISSKATTA